LEQIARFERSTRLLEDRLGYSFLKHVLNSSGISNFPEAQFDLVRLGIGLYGVSNDPSEQKHLRLVGRWVSEVAQIKHVKAGETVGYGRAFKAENDTRIATVSLGYADGLSRRLGEGVGKLYWKDRDFPIAGRVCMDMCMLDIGDAPIQEGDEIVVFERPDQLLDLARALGTIPYEVLTSISTRVRRVYLQE
jgi:alanine racemase